VIYDYACTAGHEFERVLPLSRYDEPQLCECGASARKIITKAPYGAVQRECVYDSPVDGRPITSWAQRRDDLARNGCQEYDPEMKKDAAAFRERQQRDLEKAVDETVEREIDRMPARKKERLTNELLGGADVTPERGAVPISTVRKLDHG
jgi:putative FmdB family regulatory protein